MARCPPRLTTRASSADGAHPLGLVIDVVNGETGDHHIKGAIWEMEVPARPHSSNSTPVGHSLPPGVFQRGSGGGWIVGLLETIYQFRWPCRRTVVWAAPSSINNPWPQPASSTCSSPRQGIESRMVSRKRNFPTFAAPQHDTSLHQKSRADRKGWKCDVTATRLPSVDRPTNQANTKADGSPHEHAFYNGGRVNPVNSPRESRMFREAGSSQQVHSGTLIT